MFRLGTDGNFYGTTSGSSTLGFGTVFKLTPGGGITTLYTFTDGNDGGSPIAPPIEGADGNFYGTTCVNCLGPIGNGNGSIYKISPSGAFTVLYDFDGAHGEFPNDPLVQGTDGNFYGTTEYGGANGYGVVFKITPAGKVTVLHNFDLTHGGYPFAPLVQGADGDFYGTAEAGGSVGSGVVFKVTPAGKFTVLHDMNMTTDGANPWAGLVQATDGNFYGANGSGGTQNRGTIFRITSSGAFSVLYNFDVTTGDIPYTTIFQHTNGTLYGTTFGGGTGSVNTCGGNGCGVLYSLNLGAPPFASLVSTSGKVGKTIEILGQGFIGTTAVTFGAASGNFKVVTDTYLTATIPAGATTASVTVNTPGGTLTSSKTFRLTPQIKSFTPPSGPVGTAVTIVGVSLTQTTKVAFGGVAATSFTVNSDTQVTATVPTGAKTGKIAITTAGGSASSPTNFTVTP